MMPKVILPEQLKQNLWEWGPRGYFSMLPGWFYVTAGLRTIDSRIWSVCCGSQGGEIMLEK